MPAFTLVDSLAAARALVGEDFTMTICRAKSNANGTDGAGAWIVCKHADVRDLLAAGI